MKLLREFFAEYWRGYIPFITITGGMVLFLITGVVFWVLIALGVCNL